MASGLRTFTAISVHSTAISYLQGNVGLYMFAYCMSSAQQLRRSEDMPPRRFYFKLDTFWGLNAIFSVILGIFLYCDVVIVDCM